MPRKLSGAMHRTAQIRRLRLEGTSWDGIAASLGLSRWSIIERGRRIGARSPIRELASPDDRSRDPLPAGHPAAGDVITGGTSLENTPYPLPVFPR